MGKRKRPMPSFYGKNIDRILIADELDKAPDRTQETRREE